MPHLKVLVCGINASSSQWCGCIFILYYTHLNLALLLHKQGLGATGVATTSFCLSMRNMRIKSSNQTKLTIRKLVTYLSSIYSKK